MLAIDDLAATAVDCGFHIHKELGPGLLESVNETVLAESLRQRGLSVERQLPVPIKFRGLTFPLTYLRLMKQPLGLLMNFGCEMFRDGVKRVVNGHDSFAP